MSKTSLIGWFMIITVAGMGLELLFNWGLFIPLLLGVFFLYRAKKTQSKRSIYVIAGIVLILIPILSSSFLKIFILIAVIYAFWEYSKSKKQPTLHTIQTVEPGEKPSYKRIQPLMKNSLIRNQRMGNEVYEWDDINIQYGFGDAVIDLSMTMLPIGESVVLIRGLVGNVQVLVPFDAAVIVNHSSITGKLSVFDSETDMFNMNVIYYPDTEDTAIRTIKIITNILVGDVEVKRL